MNAPPLRDLFGEVEIPVIAAWGAGVDSTAMIIEWLAQGNRLDVVLFADTGSEKPETYEFLALFTTWLTARGVPVHVVRYVPKNFKNWPPYYSLEENCIINATLPSIAFGFGSCSLKWKVEPQNRWVAAWEPAQRVWAAGGRVRKLIGYDCSPADNARYAHASSLQQDERYDFEYPLREWGWKRKECEERILAEGLPVPLKSACFFCSAQRPAELEQLSTAHLRRIVLMEARAKPRLRNVDGLWRKPVQGKRGAIPRPGSMTAYIREKGLLPAAEIDAIETNAPKDLVAWQDAVASLATNRPAMREWMDLFDTATADDFRVGELHHLYGGMGRAA